MFIWQQSDFKLNWKAFYGIILFQLCKNHDIEFVSLLSKGLLKTWADKSICHTAFDITLIQWIFFSKMLVFNMEWKSLDPESYFNRIFIHNSNLKRITFWFNQIFSQLLQYFAYVITTYCAKFCSNGILAVVYRNYLEIWITLEKLLVKWAPSRPNGPLCAKVYKRPI